MIEVLKIYRWHFAMNNMQEGGLTAQVSYCRSDNIYFYVRENVNGIDSFHISSGERWGDKSGNKPSRSRQVLELFVPQAEQWQLIAGLVREIDTLDRPVLANRLFNQQWILDFVNKNKHYAIQPETKNGHGRNQGHHQ